MGALFDKVKPQPANEGAKSAVKTAETANADSKEPKTPKANADSKDPKTPEANADSKEPKTPEARRRKNVIELSKKLKAELDDKKVTLSEEGQKALQVLMVGGLETSSTSRGSFLQKIFPELKEGASVSATDLFLKHKKGPYEMNAYIKQWAQQGITVALDEASGSYKVTKITAGV